MYYYKIYDLIIESDMDFMQLVEVEEQQPDVRVIEGEMPQSIYDAEANGTQYIIDSKFSWLCNRTCYFTVENGTTITYKFRPGMNEQYLRTYILGFGMAMLAFERGQLAMHCSVVSKDGSAVLICGEPGAGKSTVTAELLEKGYSFMADDMAFVETIDGVSYVKPAFPYQKLCRDAAIEKGYDLDKEIYIDEEKDKFLVRYNGEFVLDRMPVSQLIYLQRCLEGDVKHVEVTGISSFYVCAENLFLRKLLGKAKYAPEIGQLCLKMAASIKVDSVIRPVEKDTLSEVMDIIEEILK